MGIVPKIYGMYYKLKEDPILDRPHQEKISVSVLPTYN